MIARYTGLLCVVGMAVAWYLTGKLNVYLLATALGLAGGAELPDFLRDIVTGATTFERARRRAQEQASGRKPPKPKR